MQRFSLPPSLHPWFEKSTLIISVELGWGVQNPTLQDIRYISTPHVPKSPSLSGTLTQEHKEDEEDEGDKVNRSQDAVVLSIAL